MDGGHDHHSIDGIEQVGTSSTRSDSDSSFLEFAFAFVTVILSNVGLGELAWLRIFVGSVIGAVVASVVLARTHLLLALLRQAEEER